MIVRQATYSDIPRIMEVCDEARGIMRINGNMSQWTGGYPSNDDIRNDIDFGSGYVIENGCSIEAYFAFVPGVECTYLSIEGGEWIDDSTPYCTIHRLASSSGSHGIADACFNWCWSKSRNLRIDTHCDNTIMRHCIEKFGFCYCGIIHLLDGAPRMAYQKIQL